MSRRQDQRNAFYNRAMCQLRAGVYGRDYGEPTSTDLPEVCAFSRYGLLEEIDYRCSETLIVTEDVRFGVIPVCTLHRKHIIKEEHNSVNQKESNRTNSRANLGSFESVESGYGTRTPDGIPYYFDTSSGHVVAGCDGW